MLSYPRLCEWHRSKSSTAVENLPQSLYNSCPHPNSWLKISLIRDPQKRLVGLLRPLESSISSVCWHPPISVVKFSCLCEFHIWLKGFCRNNDIPFVDNFTSFLNLREPFKAKWSSPKWRGFQYSDHKYWSKLSLVTSTAWRWKTPANPCSITGTVIFLPLILDIFSPDKLHICCSTTTTPSF